MWLAGSQESCSLDHPSQCTKYSVTSDLTRLLSNFDTAHTAGAVVFEGLRPADTGDEAQQLEREAGAALRALTGVIVDDWGVSADASALAAICCTCWVQSSCGK